MFKLLIKLPFQGFYHSIHDKAIDYEIERLIENDHGHTDPGIASELYDVTPHVDLQRAYAKEYVNWYNKAFEDQLGFNLNLEPEKLMSPTYYNFETDRMFAYVDANHIKRFALEVDSEILDAEIKRRFTSRDGFWSHYDDSLFDDEWFEAAIDQWDHNMLETLLVAYLKTKEVDLSESEIMCQAYENGDIRQVIEETIPAESEFWTIVNKAYELNYGSEE